VCATGILFCSLPIASEGVGVGVGVGIIIIIYIIRMAIVSESFHFPRIETLYSDELEKILSKQPYMMIIPGGSPIDKRYRVFKDATGSILAYTDITGKNEPIQKGTALRVFNDTDPYNPLYYHYSPEHSGMKRKRTKRRRTLKHKSNRKRITKSKQTRSQTRRSRK